jgi:hypothetical protein
MDIFQVNDLANSQTIYYVPDTTTQTDGVALGIPNTAWNVGILTDAQNQLILNQQAYLTQQADRFSVAISYIDANGYQVWSSCDLTLEQPNTSKTYHVFNSIDGTYTEATGLDAANALFVQMQQTFLTWCNMSSVITLTTLPTAPKKSKGVVV